MKAEDIIGALFDADAALPDDQRWAAALARAARARRADEEGGLAQGEHLDGAWFDEEEARAASRDEDEVLRLAAAPARDEVPTRYTSEGWSVALARTPDGGYSALLAGPTGASLELPSGQVRLEPRRWTPLRVATPPALLSLHLPDGRVLILNRSS